MTETPTIRVSKKTAEALEGTRENLKAESIDDAIQSLIRKQRKATLEQLSRSLRAIAVKIVIDSYAWIELFIGSPEGNKVKEVLAQADELYIPDIVFAEIVRKFYRDGFD